MENVNYNKENIFLSLVNHNYCKDKLVGKPSRNFLDMDVAYSFYRPDSSVGTTWLNNEDMKALGLSEEELFDTALINTMKRYPARIEKLEDIVMEMMNISNGSAEDFELDPEYRMPIYYLGNTSCSNGSAVILYSNILKRIAELFGEDYYILPSSIHEYLIIPESGIEGDISYLLEMVRSVNRSVLTEDMVLSDSVYHYCLKSNNLSMISQI